MTDGVAWFHCFSGIAGDMALGALVDAGADLDEVRALLERLPVGGWALEAEPVLRGGIAATKVHVRAEDDARGPHRRPHHRPGRGGPPARAGGATGRCATFRALAEVEGRLHRRPPEQVHFHEVGGIDAIVDVVGTCAALEVLGVDEVVRQPGRQRHAAWSAPPTACCPTRRPRSSSCCGARRPTASTCPSS